MTRIVLLVFLALSACSEHPAPPEPKGALVPVNASLWNYTGSEVIPGGSPFHE
jgi:hypothetical protein